MNKVKVVSRSGASLWALVMAVLWAPSAAAQEAAQPAPAPAPAPQPDTPIGPRELRDFQLTPRQRIVSQPRPAPAPEQAAPQPAQTSAPAAEQPAAGSPETRARPEPPRASPTAPRAPVATAPAGGSAAPTPDAPAAAAPPPQTADPVLPSAPLPQAATPAPATDAPAPALIDDVAPPASEGPPLWMILLGGLALGLIGYTLFTRRRAAERRALAVAGGAPLATTTIVQPQAPRAPRPDPVPRPWLEVELVAERTTADPAESAVEFELTVRNNGGSTARNVRLQAKLICSTPNQDKDIAAFHRKKPGEHRTLAIPDIPAGQELKMKGRVDVKREEIRALKVEERLLFVPLIAVNAFYDWGTARSGQTSKSFLVGRKRADQSEKMAPFRLDLGPRIYRTVEQRPYNVERRV